MAPAYHGSISIQTYLRKAQFQGQGAITGFLKSGDTELEASYYPTNQRRD